MAPTLAVVAWGVDANEALVASQVVLSPVLPVPMIALVCVTGSPRIMGGLASHPAVTAIVAAIAILALNALIVLDALRVKLPV